MGVTTQRIFRAKVEARLDGLEEDVEELERNAKERRARLTELGVAHEPSTTEYEWEAIAERWLAPAQRAYEPVAKQIASVNEMARDPRVGWAGRVAWEWMREGARYLAIACAVLLPFVLAIALLAPPD
jgi:hypothetical protein